MSNTTWGDLGHYSDLVSWWNPAGAWSPDPRLVTVALSVPAWSVSLADTRWAFAAPTSTWTLTKD